MNKYENGKIYKVVNDTINIVYIGSTIQTLNSRMASHRSSYKKKLTSTYSKWGDINDCKIILIEKYCCNNLIELKQRERFFIETTINCNHILPLRTKKEYRTDNKDFIKKLSKDWYNKNKKKKLEQSREWYEKNKKKKLEQSREWYEKNKEAINKKRREKYSNK